MSQHRLDKLTGFLGKVEFLDRVGPQFELRDVDYTSSTAAVAYFVDVRPTGDLGSVIATTDDNWAHSARLRISWDLADLVDYFPLGRGAVAIKAQDQFPRKSYPPFVLYPDGQVKPLRVVEPRELDADHELLGIGVYNLFPRLGWDEPQGLWAADVEAAEVSPIPGSPLGDVHRHLPGRAGSVMSVRGYRSGIGDGVWRFHTTTDAGRSWQRTDVSLPLERKSLGWYADVSTHAVGPGHLQAIAMSDAPEDVPLYLWELWRTNDEKEFRRVPLPWERMRFGGMAFASDGALLLAEVQGADTWCGTGDKGTCRRPGRIWRLAPGGTEPQLLSEAPRLFGPFWAVGIGSSGGLIVARTGLRTIALSDDGYGWTKVVPGRADVSPNVGCAAVSRTCPREYRRRPDLSENPRASAAIRRALECALAAVDPAFRRVRSDLGLPRRQTMRRPRNRRTTLAAPMPGPAAARLQRPTWETSSRDQR